MDDIKLTTTEQLQQLQMLMHRAAFRGYRSGRQSRNLYRDQGRVLTILKLKPGISQRDLPYLLDMSKQSLAELFARPEKSGYVTREPSQEDKRVLTIELTEEGMEAAESVEQKSSDTKNVLDCPNEEELITLSDSFQWIIERHEERFLEADYE